MSNYKRIVFVGAGACGKNYAVELLKNVGFIYGPSFTTRPIRENEKNGVDYIFISRKDFEAMIDDGEFIEFNNFNGNYYGTTNKQFYDSCNLFILSPNVVASLPEKARKETRVIYFNIPESILRKRLLDRGMSVEEVNKRTLNDLEMLKDFSDYDLEIKNPTFNKFELLKDFNYEEI